RIRRHPGRSPRDRPWVGPRTSAAERRDRLSSTTPLDGARSDLRSSGMTGLMVRAGARRLRPLQPGKPDHPVRVDHETLDVRAQGEEDGLVVEIDDRQLVLEDLLRRVIALLAFGDVIDGAGLVEQLVDLGVGVTA